MVKERFDDIIRAMQVACESFYGDRLVSLAVFGSTARGTMRPDSDVDLLLVADPLPLGRLNRVREFEAVEHAVARVLEAAQKDGIYASLSPMIKTPQEVEQGSPLFLDMVDEAKILVDRHDFLRQYLDRLAARLKALGARRVYSGGGYYWLLKPDLKPGEEIVL